MFQETDLSKACELYDEMVGRVGIITKDGYPRIIPVNFVLMNKMIYFHGATGGEKYELVKQSPKVTFQIDKVYSYLPSNWLDSQSGCNATICYKSLYIKGVGTLVDDKIEKVESLQALMVKHQDSETFLPITPDESRYENAIKATAIFRIEATTVDLKYKFAQNHPEKVRLRIIEKLKERNDAVDLETIDEIKKTLTP